MLGVLYLMPSLPMFLPICDSPGVEAADTLVRHNTQVGIVVLSVPLDVSQRAARHRDNNPLASLHWAWEHNAASGLLLILGYLLCQAALREDTVSKETPEETYVAGQNR